MTLSQPAWTQGTFNYYAAPSSMPMEEQVLISPFDYPSNLQKNLASQALKSHELVVQNGRLDRDLYFVDPLPTAEAMRVLDSRGFFCLKWPSATTDFWDASLLMQCYFPEIKSLALSLTGADRLAVASHTHRMQGDATHLTPANRGLVARGAAFTVHNDFSNKLTNQFVEMHENNMQSIITDRINEGGLGLDNIDDLKNGRLCIINFWRSIGPEPANRNPLAILDAATMGSQDIVQCRHVAKRDNASFLKHYRLPVPFINTLTRRNPSHQWYYFPEMDSSEVLVFKNYDSLSPQPSNGVGMHSSFDDPQTPVAAPSRESLEVRIMCFWFDRDG